MQVSSRLTFYYKRVFPAVWFGVVSIIFLVALFSQFSSRPAPVLALIVPIGLLAVGYLVMRALIFDLIDEVIDNGDSLTLRNAGTNDRINYDEIEDIDYQYIYNPPRVSLRLKRPCKFGSRIVFAAPTRLIPFAKSRQVEELISRIKKK